MTAEAKGDDLGQGAPRPRAGERVDAARTALVKKLYDRQAAAYDRRLALIDRLFERKLRRRLWGKVTGNKVLELGVGTGRNMEFYPEVSEVTGVDISDRMLAIAQGKAAGGRPRVELHRMDAQELLFPDDSFDAVAATWVFCSVPDAVLGLKEARRVLKPEGRLFLLEHVRPPGVLGILADIANPLAVRLHGANINRRTVENVVRAGFELEEVESFGFGIARMIVASPGRKPSEKDGSRP
ncbi:MAG: methyltransferase domain-containing protein [Firmicutes bacterium]|nr:methyltransferase domain-containing protein [Bacillota bacterium]